MVESVFLYLHPCGVFTAANAANAANAAGETCLHY